MKKKTRCRGFLFAELIVSMALLGLIIAGLAVSMNGFSMVNDCQWARQRCTAAAQAQLDSIVTRGSPIEPPELQRLWAGVDVVTEKTPGVAPWEGLELVQVTASAQPGPKKVTVRLARYIGRASAHAGGSRVIRSVPAGNSREERSGEGKKVRSREGEGSQTQHSAFESPEKALPSSPVPAFSPFSVVYGVAAHAAEGGRS